MDEVNGSTLDERASNGEGTEAEEELFPLGSIDGDDKTLQTLFRKNLPTKVTTSIRAGEVGTPRGGLLDPERAGMLLVSYEYDHPEIVPEYEGEAGSRKVKALKIRQVVRPYFIEQVRAGEAGVIEAQFAELMKADVGAAGKLLDALNARAGKALAGV